MNIKIRESVGQSFDDSAIRKQYSAEKNSANDFSAIRRDSQFIYRPNAIKVPRANMYRENLQLGVKTFFPML